MPTDDQQLDPVTGGPKQAPSPGDDVAKILAEVKNPLQFFGLALLVTETAIGTVVRTGNLTGLETLAAFGIMSGLFLSVVLIVAIITISWPKNLYQNVIENVIEKLK